MESKWLKDSLFSGMTANAFKLGTVLTQGWFWTRVTGCSILYRGSSMRTIDFENILAAAQRHACQIQPPCYISHNSDSTYFYVLRRANKCGYLEHTLSAAVKVSIDATGNLAQPQPNSIFVAKGEQIGDGKIRLIWYYCPLDQQSLPARFRIYYDAGTGQINYETPVATVRYSGRFFYSHDSDALEPGIYLFAIRAEDANQIENKSSTHILVQVDTSQPCAIGILSAIAI
jgi:hypothetical protein